MTQRMLLTIAWRFMRGKTKSKFASFISWASMLSIALGVLSLITVMSVLNGFDAEIKQRVLLAEPHAQINASAELFESALIDQRVLASAKRLSFSAVGQTGRSIQGVEVNAVDPIEFPDVVNVPRMITSGSWFEAQGAFNVVVSQTLARRWGISVGDRLKLILPSTVVTPVGVFPRSKMVTVSGIYYSGSDADGQQIYTDLNSGLKLLRASEQDAGYAVSVRDPFTVDTWFQEYFSNHEGTHWLQRQAPLFAAVKMEKRITTLVLFAMIAIGAFNMIAALSMQVLNKRKEIAVLRTQGLSREQSARIFLFQGLIIAAVGLALGGTLGIALTLNLTEVSNWVQSSLGWYLFDPSVYAVDWLPTRLLFSDVALVLFVTALICFGAIRYPVSKALKIEPSEALNYE